MSDTFKVHGSFANIRAFLRRMESLQAYITVEKMAVKGVQALQAHTPMETGLTAVSWDYEIIDGEDFQIIWKNTNIVGDVNVAVILQCGHGTGTGGYVVGRDYINPALEPIFNEIRDTVWKAVTSA